MTIGQPPTLSHFTPDAVVAYVTDLRLAPSYENHPYYATRPQSVSPAAIAQRVRAFAPDRLAAIQESIALVERPNVKPLPKQGDGDPSSQCAR